MTKLASSKPLVVVQPSARPLLQVISGQRREERQNSLLDREERMKG
jgi:hypothetical protein